MPPDPRAVRAAADTVLQTVTSDRRYRHTNHLHVRVQGEVVVDQHLHGPVVGEVFSVTKSVLSTVLGVMAARGRLPPLDRRVAEVLPALHGTPAEVHTWRQLLTMTRGAATDGPWDVDQVTALPGGQVTHIAAAPQRNRPGSRFTYDNGAAHLVSAGMSALLDEPVSAFAGRALFAPLGLGDTSWATDPDGVPFGFAHLRISASDLGRIGQLWLDGGRLGDRALLDPGYFAAMTSAQTHSGGPEHLPYGFLTWIDAHGPLAAGWSGQHLLAVPAVSAVIVVTADPHFDPGPPPTDDLPADWLPGIDLVRRHLLPVLAP